MACIVPFMVNQGFLQMANDALAPDVNEGDIIKYQKVPLSEIKKNDIIAYIDSTGEFTAKVGKVRSIEVNVEGVVGFKTSNNVSPQKLYYVPAENFTGKITHIGSVPLLSNGTILLLVIVGFVSPIIILNVRKRIQK